MYCASCGYEITVELNYCKRCGANLTLTAGNLPAAVLPPIKLTAPTLVLGLTLIGAMGVIFAGVTELARLGIHPAALAWIVIFSMGTLFGCTALLIRFWSKIAIPQREQRSIPATPKPALIDRGVTPQLPPRDPAPSVTENTTRTFSPIYRESAGKGSS